jgi:hypothetical protein
MLAYHNKSNVKPPNYNFIQRVVSMKALEKNQSVMHDTDEECAFCKKPFTKEQRECLREIYKHTHNKKEESEPQMSATQHSTGW